MDHFMSKVMHYPCTLKTLLVLGRNMIECLLTLQITMINCEITEEKFFVSFIDVTKLCIVCYNVFPLIIMMILY